MSRALIAITMGDPAGIGPEVIAKTFADPDFHIQNFAVVIGDVYIMQRAVKLLNLNLKVRTIQELHTASQQKGIINVLPVSKLPEDMAFGEIDVRAGAAAFQYIKKAIELALSGQVDAIATAPLNKEALHLAGLKYPGHTEILADLTDTKDFAMMLTSDTLRVIHVSTHVSLSEAIRNVTKERELIVIRLADQALTRLEIERPKVAVAGLNPHAGEGGIFGTEDLEIIHPAIEAAKAEGLNVTGPLPPDTVFMRAINGEFDIVVAQYHDQGHIPLKLLGFDTGVNVTVGLPFWRTSVDHGTAFDIAGTGKAKHASMRAAIDLARILVLSKKLVRWNNIGGA
jgi:4-hydroxythreonine-4-phosphate dehydrogenase